MSSTPVLTKQQQRHSLSAKKTPVKGLRNVLAQPHESFWPLVSKCSELEEIFKDLAPAARRTHVRRKRLKSNNGERTTGEETEEEQVSRRPDLVQSIILGINAVARSLETNAVCCVLLDSEIDPPFMVKHILSMAQNKRVPVLLLPSLKMITAISIGFPSASFGLKSIVKETKDHHFHPLYEHIVSMFKQLPLPKNSLALFNNADLGKSSAPEDEEVAVKEESELRSTGLKEFTLSTNVYKYRSSRAQRAFVPPSVKETSSLGNTESADFIPMNVSDSETTKDNHEKAKHAQNLSVDTESGDFIPLGNCDSDTEENNVIDGKKSKRENVSCRSTSVSYLSLKVKRIQGNSNRTKAIKTAKLKKK